jgi:hypothetical protein
MGGHTMREGLTVGRSLSAAAIVRLRRAGVNGSVAFYSTPSAQPRACSHYCSPFALTCGLQPPPPPAPCGSADTAEGLFEAMMRDRGVRH